MRKNGRQPDQLRPVTITTQTFGYGEGSALVVFGETQVLCNLTVEDITPRWMQLQGKPGGWITAEYAMLPRATRQRTRRETSGLSGRTQEIRRLIGRSLRAAVNLEKLGPRSLIVDCDVLQADGGTRTAAITGGYVALALAVRRLVAEGKAAEGALLAPVAAVSAGIVAGERLLDLDYDEDSAAEVDFNVVMNAQGAYIEVQGTAEGQPFSRAALDEILALSQQGITRLLAIQQAAIEAAA